MIKTNKTPRIKASHNPYIEGAIDKSNSCLAIGSCDLYEDVFRNGYPGFVKILAKIVTKSEFPDVEISARYKVQPNDDPKIMSFNLYDGSKIDMTKHITEMSLEFTDVIQDGFTNFSKIQKYLEASPALFSKSFEFQNSSKTIENFVAKSPKGSSLIHTKTKDHPFGGFYDPLNNFAKFEQYSFVLGTGNKGTPYIETKPYCSINLLTDLINHEVKIDSLTYQIKEVHEFKKHLLIYLCCLEN